MQRDEIHEVRNVGLALLAGGATLGAALWAVVAVRPTFPMWGAIACSVLAGCGLLLTIATMVHVPPFRLDPPPIEPEPVVRHEFHPIELTQEQRAQVIADEIEQIESLSNHRHRVRQNSLMLELDAAVQEGMRFARRLEDEAVFRPRGPLTAPEAERALAQKQGTVERLGRICFPDADDRLYLISWVPGPMRPRRADSPRPAAPEPESAWQQVARARAAHLRFHESWAWMMDVYWRRVPELTRPKRFRTPD